MKFIILVFAVLSLSGCATAPTKLMYLETNENSVLLQNKEVAKSILLSQYDEWKGTKYEYGGLSKEGIDCSGFVYRTLADKFGVKLPRQSIIQGKVGVDVSVKDLLPGDLVFFKTGIGVNHIGIYLDNGEFMHVSQSQGVTKSNLNETYWRKRYWKCRRITVDN